MEKGASRSGRALSQFAVFPKAVRVSANPRAETTVGTRRPNRHSVPMSDAESHPVSPANAATFSVRGRRFRLSAKVKVSPQGLLAVGGLVSSILLSTAALVWVAATPARRRAGSAGRG